MKKKAYLTYFTLVLLLIVISLFRSKYINFNSIYSSGDSYSQIVEKVSTNKKAIALTFDDGPHPKFTPQILDLLKEYDVRATFFVLGEHVELYPNILKREVAEGHEIGNHSYSHIDVHNASEEAIREEFEKTQELIFSISNIKPKLIRPPFGYYNNETINMASENHWTIILWSRNHDCQDWRNPGIQKITDTVLSKTENGNIILLHDCVYEEKSDTTEALKTIIPDLIDKGYEFLTISELIALSME